MWSEWREWRPRPQHALVTSQQWKHNDVRRDVMMTESEFQNHRRDGKQKLQKMLEGIIF